MRSTNKRIHFFFFYGFHVPCTFSSYFIPFFDLHFSLCSFSSRLSLMSYVLNFFSYTYNVLILLLSYLFYSFVSLICSFFHRIHASFPSIQLPSITFRKYLVGFLFVFFFFQTYISKSILILSLEL